MLNDEKKKSCAHTDRQSCARWKSDLLSLTILLVLLYILLKILYTCLS